MSERDGVCSRIYDDLLNADIPKNPNEAMNAIDAVEWRESMQYELDVLEERGVWTTNGCLRGSTQMISRSSGDCDFASEVSSKR